MKKIEKGRFNWPAYAEDKIMPIAFRELEILIESTRLRSKLRREQVFIKPGHQKPYTKAL
jgi:hypothetical protein